MCGAACTGAPPPGERAARFRGGPGGGSGGGGQERRPAGGPVRATGSPGTAAGHRRRVPGCAQAGTPHEAGSVCAPRRLPARDRSCSLSGTSTECTSQGHRPIKISNVPY
ncbi:hypothetical protein D8771_00105 [Streptomyces albus]|uniref:Uncharacterized protein n=1 Tax=Streptomyces albus TaxID=1888 RepID=A0A8H1LJG5_9ACTN|nr:hypothetical protein D8771_00105 [Streptomyces albus]